MSGLPPPTPRRLCIVNPFQHGGGAELQIDYLIDVLRRTGRWDIYYLAHHLAPGIAKDRYRVVKIGNGEKAPRFGYAADAISLYRTLNRLRPDVIYQRVAGAYTGVCGLYALKQRVRFIWHVAHDTDVSPEQIGSGKNFVRHFLEKRFGEFGLRRADRIVVQKQEQAKLLEVNYGRTATAVIPNFHAEPHEQIDKSGAFTIVWVSNFKQWKQPEMFIRLADRLKEFSDVRFVMIGHLDASSGDREWVEDLQRDMEKTSNLFYAGAKRQDEVNTLLAGAHLFVNTSKGEGFPNTFIQAWMRGVPVVSLHVDPDGVLERKRIGVHAQSEENLTNAVRMFITDRALLNEYAANAMVYSRQTHSLANAERLVELIECDDLLQTGNTDLAADFASNRQSS